MPQRGAGGKAPRTGRGPSTSKKNTGKEPLMLCVGAATNPSRQTIRKVYKKGGKNHAGRLRGGGTGGKRRGIRAGGKGVIIIPGR